MAARKNLTDSESNFESVNPAVNQVLTKQLNNFKTCLSVAGIPYFVYF